MHPQIDHDLIVKGYKERIAELEQENDRLRGLTVKLAREGFDEGYDAGMERAAELKEQVRVDCSAMPNSSIDAALQHYERAIRAEIDKGNGDAKTF